MTAQILSNGFQNLNFERAFSFLFEGNRRLVSRERLPNNFWYLAFIPGSYFAVTNYLQHGFVTGWFGSIIAAIITAIAFVIVYNFYALVVRAQWAFVDTFRRHRISVSNKALIHGAVILSIGSIYMLLISGLTAVTREGARWSAEIGFYYQEIWISCMPIWGLLYLGTLGICTAVQSASVSGPIKSTEAESTPVSKLAIRDNGTTHYLEPSSIKRVVADGDYVKVHAGNQIFMPKGSIAKFENELCGSGAFLRVHRSCLLRADCIKAINRLSTGAYQLRLDDGETAPLSRKKVSLVKGVLEGAG